jgi:hypothetical protein
LCVNPNPALSNLLGLHHRGAGIGSEFAGFQRVSVSFMQSVIELLTDPGDIVLDWAVGDGSTFLAGDLCNRFVVGVENRKEFADLAERAIAEVRRKAAPEVERFTLPRRNGSPVVGRLDHLLSDTEGDARERPVDLLKEFEAEFAEATTSYYLNK